ncbi:hypothetical protein EF834_17440 [Rhodococcus spongiicola]|uniref:Uncharacterized protein n=1 Tax=Rhodococcus spongiicola TaxID=2487352 RepID=A0A3S3B0S3_9NOCA|nr:hypothetical protein EF834_17440 [Rhodococcus spongiicola]
MALASTAALAIPGTAFAVEAPNVTVATGINTATFTITAPESALAGCLGPWIHTEADAIAILNSPTLDVANNPLNWLVGNPVSPITPNGDRNSDGSLNYVYPEPGQTEVAKIPYIADGEYVAGSLCMGWDGAATWALTQTPFTIGSPDSSPGPGGSATGSLGSLSFGS